MRFLSVAILFLAHVVSSRRLQVIGDNWEFIPPDQVQEHHVDQSRSLTVASVRKIGKDGAIVRCSSLQDLVDGLSVTVLEQLEISLPMPTGKLRKFALTRTTAEMFSEEMQAKFPLFQTYDGYSIDNNGKKKKPVVVELDVTPTSGVHVQFQGQGWIGYMDPVSSTDSSIFHVYVHRQSAKVSKENEDWTCGSEGPIHELIREKEDAEETTGLSQDEGGRRLTSSVDRATDQTSVQDRATDQTSVHHHAAAHTPAHTSDDDRHLASCNFNWVGDGYCDHVNNFPACQWDGGDCCGRDVKMTYCRGSRCKCLEDPFPVVDDDGCVVSYLDDHVCDAINNRETCNYDGGDCCSLFGSNSECVADGGGDFCNCLDPGHNSVLIRSYKMAVCTTTMYSLFHGNTRESVLSAVMTAVARVSGIMKLSLGISLNLINDVDDLFELHQEGAPAELVNNVGVVNQIAGFINQRGIGPAKYDFGHAFSTGSGGYAPGNVCSDAKTRATTGISQPINDGYYIDYVAHEIGHQFNADHTFNGALGSCGGAFHPNVNYEPGSGSTIMAYAGICGPDNIATNSDPYYHVASLQQIRDFVNDPEAGGSCGKTYNNTRLTSPQFALPFGDGECTIPKQTAFQLSVADEHLQGIEDGGLYVLYNWEQLDLGPQTTAQSPTRNGPLFESQSPSESASRTFPSWDMIINGPGNTHQYREQLPHASRELTMTLTARKVYEMDLPGRKMDGNYGTFLSKTVKLDISKYGPLEFSSTPRTILVSSNVEIIDLPFSVSWRAQGVDRIVESLRLEWRSPDGETRHVLQDNIPTDAETLDEIELPKSLCEGVDGLIPGYLMLVGEPVSGCSFFAITERIEVLCNAQPTNQYDLYFAVDRQLASSLYDNSCGVVNTRGRSGWSCWELISQFIEDTVLRVLDPGSDVQAVANQWGTNLKVSIGGFACARTVSRKQVRSLAFQWANNADSQEEFNQGLVRFLSDVSADWNLLNMGPESCPAELMELVLGEVEAEANAGTYDKGLTSAYKTMIVITNNAIGDRDRAFAAASTLHKFLVDIMFVGIQDTLGSKKKKKQQRGAASMLDSNPSLTSSELIFPLDSFSLLTETVASIHSLVLLQSSHKFNNLGDGFEESPSCSFGQLSSFVGPIIGDALGPYLMEDTAAVFQEVCTDAHHAPYCTFSFETGICYDSSERFPCSELNGFELQCSIVTTCEYRKRKCRFDPDGEVIIALGADVDEERPELVDEVSALENEQP